MHEPSRIENGVKRKGKEKTSEPGAGADSVSREEQPGTETEVGDRKSQPDGQESEITDQEGTDDAEATTDATPEQRLEAVQAELDELNARFFRVSADYQNYVRRAQQNVGDARAQQLMDVARALLGVLDNFDRALEVDPEATAAGAVLEGMQIVHDELLKKLEQFGVERVEVCAGDEFDPNRHEALLRQSVEGIEPNHVVAQLQPGYVLGDKVIRPAKVSVGE